jgi:predicted metal-dependent enzyme (double-stranded beta helix superfamily)
VESIINELVRLDWADKGWRKEAADVLSCWSSPSKEISGYIRSWDDRLRAARYDGSHETSTHYKWLIYRDESRRFTLWLHDYKLSGQRGPGYAQTPHNHRYDLCSLLLRGGYDTVLYDVSGSVKETGRATLRPGGTLSLDCDQVHALERICEGTQSLFIEGPTMRNYSTAFPVDGEPRDFVDFTGRSPDFLARLDQDPAE